MNKKSVKLDLFIKLFEALWKNVKLLKGSVWQTISKIGSRNVSLGNLLIDQMDNSVTKDNTFLELICSIQTLEILKETRIWVKLFIQNRQYFWIVVVQIWKIIEW